ncbi:hypothetical protein [Aeromonas veronii]
MSACLVVANGQAIITQDTGDNCQGYVLVTVTEYKQQVGALSNFDKDVAYEVSGFMLLTFMSGHFAGRLVKWLGKR